MNVTHLASTTGEYVSTLSSIKQRNVRGEDYIITI